MPAWSCMLGRPATITLFNCMPPQVPDFDEETKARPGIPNLLNKTFAFVWRCFHYADFVVDFFRGAVFHIAVSPGIVIALLKWLNQRVRVFSTTIATRDCGNFVPGHCTAIMLSHSCSSHLPDIFCCLMMFDALSFFFLFSHLIFFHVWSLPPH